MPDERVRAEYIAEQVVLALAQLAICIHTWCQVAIQLKLLSLTQEYQGEPTRTQHA